MTTDLSRRYAEGTWLTPRLITVTATLGLIGTVMTIAVLLATRTSTVDRQGRPVGTDFS